MDESYTFPDTQTRVRRFSTRSVIIALFAAFLIGGGAMFVLVNGDANPFDEGTVFRLRSEPVAEGAGAAAPAVAEGTVPSAPATAEETRQAVERVEQVVVQQGGLDQRVAAMEQRLTRLDLQAQAAAGNAARAEDLLILFAVRRAIERGTELGYLSDQLRMRFGETRPNMVQTIIDSARAPVTLDQLMAQLEGLDPALREMPADEGFFTRVGREMSQMFIIRTEDTPSPATEQRLERAKRYLESGRIEAAVGEVEALPNAAAAREWLAQARRFALVQRALETLETAAVLEPRAVPDATGRSVMQTSPAAGPAR